MNRILIYAILPYAQSLFSTVGDWIKKYKFALVCFGLGMINMYLALTLSSTLGRLINMMGSLNAFAFGGLIIGEIRSASFYEDFVDDLFELLRAETKVLMEICSPYSTPKSVQAAFEDFGRVLSKVGVREDKWRVQGEDAGKPENIY